MTLDKATVSLVAHSVLFPDSETPREPRNPRQALQLQFSSEVDLIKYFENWRRQIQVRCSVEGNANGRSYRSFGLDLVPEGKAMGGAGTPHPNSGAATRHRYSVYAFIDLEADDDLYDKGKPATTLNLKTETFESLRCYVIGVEMGAMIYPRSNDLVVSSRTFNELLRQSHSK